MGIRRLPSPDMAAGMIKKNIISIACHYLSTITGGSPGVLMAYTYLGIESMRIHGVVLVW